MSKSISLITLISLISTIMVDAQNLTMLVGTYTDTDSKGIYTFKFDANDGTATPLSIAQTEAPSFLAFSKDGKTVYSISESPEEKAKAVSFAFDKTAGTLNQESEQKTNAAGPCHITATGKEIITANYSDGSITFFPLDENGKILPAKNILKFKDTGKDTARQNKSHLHSTQVTPNGKYLIAANLGGDCLYRFKINDGYVNYREPYKIRLPEGSGPRHFAFSPNGKCMYLINELSGSVIVLKHFEKNDNKIQIVQEIQADTLFASGSADIHVSPDGKFLYASNRLKGDGIAIFKINRRSGILTKAGYQNTGIHPRNFAITPDGKYLLVACRDDNIIQVFKRDETTGLLTNTQKDIKISHPVCIIFAKN